MFIKELRKYFALVFISWAYRFLPDDAEFKIRLSIFIDNNLHTIDELKE